MVDISNLEAYWECDENAANTTVADSHGSIDLTASTNTSNLTNADGFDLDGSSEEFSGSFSKTFDDAFTVSWRMGWDDQPTDPVQVVFESQTFARGLLFVGGGTTGAIFFRLDEGGTDAVFESVFSGTEVNYYMLTYDGTDVRLYVNGSEHAQSPIAKTYGPATFTSINIGFRGNATLFFNGILGKIGIWSDVRTAQDAIDLYNSGDGLDYPLGPAPSGWTGKIQGISPGKVQSIAVANISKIQGVS